MSNILCCAITCILYFKFLLFVFCSKGLLLFRVSLASSLYGVFPGFPSRSIHFGDVSEANGHIFAWTT